MTKELEGRVALVTGAAGAIGRATAHALAAEGADLVVVDINERAGGLIEELKTHGTNVHAVWMSVQTPEAPFAIVELAEHHSGRAMDIVVHAAGNKRVGKIGDGPKEEAFNRWVAVRTCHLDPAYYFAHACLPKMIASGYGRMILFGSGSHNGSAGQANYAASKAGLLGLAWSVAQEIGDTGVTINCILPSVRSDLNATSKNGPEPTAELVTGLCMQTSKYVNGQVLSIDGPQLAMVGHIEHAWAMTIGKGKGAIRSHLETIGEVYGHKHDGK